MVRFFDTEPRVALMSYSNFGSSKGEVPDKMALVLVFELHLKFDAVAIAYRKAMRDQGLDLS